MKKLKFILIFLSLIAGTGARAQETLTSYLELAADHHPALKASFHEYLAALERTSTQALPDPQMSFGYFISPVETRVGPQRFKLSLAQMFPWFGTVSKEKEVASQLARARFEAFRLQKIELYREVRKRYYDLLSVNEIRALIQEEISLIEAIRNLSSQRFENNQGTMVEVIKAGMVVSQLQTDHANLVEEFSIKSNNFNLLLGRASEAPIELSPPDSLTYWQSDSASNWSFHPAIRQIEEEVSSFNERIELSRLRGRPQVGLGLDYVFVDKISGVDIEDNGKNAFMPMVSMSLPIFTKKYKAATREAELLKESRVDRLEHKKLQLNNDLGEVYLELKRAGNDIALYNHLIDQTTTALNVLLAAYGGNEANFEALLEMQRLNLEYKKNRQNALRNLRVGWAEYQYLTFNEIEAL